MTDTRSTAPAPDPSGPGRDSARPASVSPAAAAVGADARAGLAWLLEAFVRRTSHVRRAVAVSPDALVLAASRGSADEDDVLAAAGAGLASLTRGVTRVAGTGEVIQTIVEAEGGFVIVASLAEATPATSATGVSGGVAAASRPDVFPGSAPLSQRPGGRARRDDRPRRPDGGRERRADRGERVLVVLADAEADIGCVGYAMTVLASQLRQVLPPSSAPLCDESAPARDPVGLADPAPVRPGGRRDR